MGLGSFSFDRWREAAPLPTAPGHRYMRQMTENTLTPEQTRRRRLLFRANHRGSHETDILLGGFVATRIESMSGAEMDALEEIMEMQDADLADWLTGRFPIPDAVNSPMMRAIKEAGGK
jgi:antitoxin CptB